MFAYIIHPKSPIHLGWIIDEAKSENYPKSDTLAAAIAISMYQLFGDDPNEIFRNPPFRISSGMPWKKDENNNKILSLPRRLDTKLPTPSGMTLKEYSGFKQIKKKTWIPKSLWQNMINNPNFLTSLDKEKRETSKISPKSRTRQRVAVDRLGGESDTFFFGETFFGDKPESGWWFLAEFDTKDAQEKFEAALRLLGDTGIGADRTTGYGHFEFETRQIDFPKPKNPAGAMLLSLWFPAENERDLFGNPHSRWELELRRGWVTRLGGTTIMREPVLMFGEGSVFFGTQKLDGTWADVTPNPPEGEIKPKTYRWGWALSIPIGIEENQGG